MKGHGLVITRGGILKECRKLGRERIRIHNQCADGRGGISLDGSILLARGVPESMLVGWTDPPPFLFGLTEESGAWQRFQKTLLQYEETWGNGKPPQPKRADPWEEVAERLVACLPEELPYFS